MNAATSEVRQLVEAAWKDFQQQDVGRLAELFHPDFNMFAHTGDLRTEGTTDRDRIQAYFDAGALNQTVLRHLDVKVYGDAALVTGYTAGLVRSTMGVTEVGTWRYTAMLVKEDDRWQLVHNHFSPLSPAPKRREG